MNLKDSNVTIMVKDMDKSVAFYQAIGFNLKERWKNYYAQLIGPGVVIGLHPTEHHTQRGSGNVSIGLSVENIDEAKKMLENLSIEVTTREEEGGQFVHFADPDGTELYFIKPKWG
ncbi:MAG: VOC family protein [Chitinophagales bacterium]